MKNKLLKSAGIAFLLLVVLASNVFAFSLGTTDGLWGRIDSTTTDETGASCERYGAVNAPTYTLFDAVGIIYNVNVGPGGQTEKYVRNPSVCTGDPNGDMGFADNTSFGEWTRTTTDLWGGFGAHTITCGATSGLFVSQYSYEQIGGFNNDRLAIEIYNGTGGTVNLASGNYSLLMFTDDRAFTKIDLTGTVTAGDVHVIATTTVGSGQTSHVDQTFTINDSYRTIVLVKDYQYASITDYGDQGDREDVYDLSLLDENQVRYGTPSPGSCPDDDGTEPNNFDLQSGFGFAGQIDSNFEPAEDQLFPIGRFCHYNNPINTPGNAFNTVPLALTINDLGCPPGQTFDPTAPSNDLNFDFLVTLDETSNSANPCAYGPSSPGWPGGSAAPNVAGDTGPNRSGCADMVKITAPNTEQSFTCVIDATHDQEYFVSIMGFTETTAGAICPDVPTGTIHFNQIYTAERVRNCYCVYASYTRNQITPVTLAYLSAEGVDNGILISWETVTETNNFGFNILRAESKDGERVQINPELIFSNLAPGDTFGSSYEFLDQTAEAGVEYVYWLEDIPLDGTEPGLHGPISAVWGEVAE